MRRHRRGGIPAGVLPDPAARTVRKAVLETEQGYVVWAIKTQLARPGGGPDPKLEVKVDAGDGAVLAVECDPQDN